MTKEYEERLRYINYAIAALETVRDMLLYGNDNNSELVSKAIEHVNIMAREWANSCVGCKLTTRKATREEFADIIYPIQEGIIREAKKYNGVKRV